MVSYGKTENGIITYYWYKVYVFGYTLEVEFQTWQNHQIKIMAFSFCIVLNLNVWMWTKQCSLAWNVRRLSLRNYITKLENFKVSFVF